MLARTTRPGRSAAHATRGPHSKVRPLAIYSYGKIVTVWTRPLTPSWDSRVDTENLTFGERFK
jgi:hypothetical protein